MKFAGEQARHGIFVDLKRMPQPVQVALRHPEPRVDLLAIIVARETEREQTVGPDFRAVEPYQAIPDVHVVVFDDDMGVAGAPQRVPRPETRAAEIAFDSGSAERTGH